MAYWIFKLADQKLYPDVPSEEYVYDNTHSVKVQAGDVFIYLDKRNGYAFSATGMVKKVTKRKPTPHEAERTERVRTVFTAHLNDVIWFTEPLSILSTSKAGRSNRAKLGIVDANLLGWSLSMPKINENMYQSILGLAEASALFPSLSPEKNDYSVPDTWSVVKVRQSVSSFVDTVLERHNYICVVCGTRLKEVVDAAHLSPYAADKNNRANPANGVCLCAYCHRALDRRLIAIQPDGKLLIDESIDDPVALEHFTRVSTSSRKESLQGVNPDFLRLTVKWFNDR